MASEENNRGAFRIQEHYCRTMDAPIYAAICAALADGLTRESATGARVLDCFAGSGALGVEALSRGAAHVTFAETDPDAREVIADNLRSLDLTARAVVVSGDGVRSATRPPARHRVRARWARPRPR